MERLVISFVWVVDSRLRASASDAYFALSVLFEFLLRCARGSYDLANDIDSRVVCIWHVNLLLLFRRFVVSRRHIRIIHHQDLINKPQALSDVLVAMSHLSCVRTQSSLLVVLGLWRNGANVWIVVFEVLDGNTSLKIVNPMSPNPNFNVAIRKLFRKVTKALGSKLLGMRSSPTLFESSFAFDEILPPSAPVVGSDVQLRVGLAKLSDFVRHWHILDLFLHRLLDLRHWHGYNIG